MTIKNKRYTFRQNVCSVFYMSIFVVVFVLQDENNNLYNMSNIGTNLEYIWLGHKLYSLFLAVCLTDTLSLSSPPWNKQKWFLKKVYFSKLYCGFWIFLMCSQYILWTIKKKRFWGNKLRLPSDLIDLSFSWQLCRETALFPYEFS